MRCIPYDHEILLMLMLMLMQPYSVTGTRDDEQTPLDARLIITAVAI